MSGVLGKGFELAFNLLSMDHSSGKRPEKIQLKYWIFVNL